jgi:hypothetical protein
MLKNNKIKHEESVPALFKLLKHGREMAKTMVPKLRIGIGIGYLTVKSESEESVRIG